MHRIQKLLSNYGYCNRRKGEELIIRGRVKVNGKTVGIGDKATEDDIITVDGKPVQKHKKVYIMFNKPVGCVTALKDDELKTIRDYVKVRERVFPVGRLDYTTSGLLLLTNDGDFANNVMHPRYEVKKTYIVKTNKAIKDAAVKQIEQGVKLKDGTTRPAKVRRIGDTVLQVSIHEGKNRIIRRIIEKLGYSVRSLERIRIGSLGLGILKPGQYKFMDERDLKRVFTRPE